MPNLSDLLPASAWPVQRFISPDEQAQTLQVALNLGIPLDWSSLLPVSATRTATAPPMQSQQPAAYPATLRSDDNATSMAGPSSPDPAQGVSAEPLRIVANPNIGPTNPFGGLLGAFFGSKTESPPAPLVQYGVVPKALPPEFRMPPAISDWQRPESYFQRQDMARLKRALANPDPNQDGLGPIFAFDAGGTERDAARAAEFLFPGSGNIVSGDWDNITADDIARLGLSTALAVGSVGLESAIARAAAAATRSAVPEAEVAEAAARAATLSRTQASRAAPFVGKITSPPPQPPAIPVEPASPQPALPPPPHRLAQPAPPSYPLLVGPPSGTQQSWEGTIFSGLVPKGGRTAYRVWGPGVREDGFWLAPNRPASRSTFIRDLAPPPENPAEYVSPVRIPGGTRIQWGKAAEAFGHPGGGDQIQLLKRLPAENYGPREPLSPESE